VCALTAAGDVEAGGSSSSEQHSRQPNGGFEYSTEDSDANGTLRDYRSTPAAAAAADGPVLIPISTHTSIRERSPRRPSSSGSHTPLRRQQQPQQQWHDSNGWHEDEDLGLVGCGDPYGNSLPMLQSPQHQQQQHQQRRLSVEMSSLPSSTPNSSRSSGTPASQQQDVTAAAAAAEQGSRLSDGSAGASGSPTAGRGVQQQASSVVGSGSNSEGEEASPGRLQKPRKASRLHKASS
jgi:hypothetical protein